jgi:L-ascorbate metabolism protein UlaG (beta-lactamase superfamily)
MRVILIAAAAALLCFNAALAGNEPGTGRKPMADQKSLDKVVANLHWLGHDTFRLDYSKGTIYFDPFKIKAGEPKGDVILASHDHFDHCVPEDIAKLQKPDSVLITEGDCAKKLSGDVRVMKPGDTLEVKGLKVEAVPAYNIDKEFHPKVKGWLGFILTVDGVRLYHAGDTDFIPEMKGLNVDVALVPVSGTYVMTADQAVEAVKAIKPQLAIPMHYGAIVGDAGDAQRFAKALEGVVPVKVLTQE